MTIERLNDLANNFERLIYIDPNYTWMARHGITDDDEIKKTVEKIKQDIRDLIDREIHRIESRRKVPLVPCTCGRKRPHIEFGFAMVTILCRVCDNRESARFENEARIAWNVAQGKDGAE